MSTTATADAVPLTDSDQTRPVNHESDVIESNHDLPARTMAGHDPQDYAAKDDAATMAASEELKHTTISDKVHTLAEGESLISQAAPGPEDDDMRGTGKATTPEPEPTDALDEEMGERLTSPKKKRGRDQDEDSKDLEGDKVDGTGSTADGTGFNGNRTTRSGPEKKRHRDTSEDPSKASEAIVEVKNLAGIDPPDTAHTTKDAPNKSGELSPKAVFGSGFNDKPLSSPSAFVSSGFASLAASSTSPFGTLGSSQPSVFGGSLKSPTSGFGASAASKLGAASTTPSSALEASGEKPATGFGGGFGGSTTSGFGGLGSGSVFGSALGNGFAGGSGPKLASFAAPGKENVSVSAKPAKAFGAPDSDEDNGSDDDDSDAGAGSDEDESGKSTVEDKKKFKATKVHIEDGESGEATLVQLRAKLFALDSKEAGWKERGVGTLKVNVPKPCVTFDQNGVPIPGSFDASGFDDDDDECPTGVRVPRLIMRQESTHRVILNTIIVRAMEFKDKPSNTAAQILFTAFEGEKEPKPINMLLKMSEANARLFRSEIDSIQHEL